jgi:hypothetical protein
MKVFIRCLAFIVLMAICTQMAVCMAEDYRGESSGSTVPIGSDCSCHDSGCCSLHTRFPPRTDTFIAALIEGVAPAPIGQNVGIFSRLGWNDGQQDAWTFTDIDYTASLGLSVRGKAWHRPHDTFGLGGVLSGAARANQRFLEAGGEDILDGDGKLNYGWEKALEAYYDLDVSIPMINLGLQAPSECRKHNELGGQKGHRISVFPW